MQECKAKRRPTERTRHAIAVARKSMGLASFAVAYSNVDEMRGWDVQHNQEDDEVAGQRYETHRLLCLLKVHDCKALRDAGREILRYGGTYREVLLENCPPFQAARRDGACASHARSSTRATYRKAGR